LHRVIHLKFCTISNALYESFGHNHKFQISPKRHLKDVRYIVSTEFYFPKKENCIIMGDFNFYRSSEAGFQTLTASSPNATYQFQDPINRVGSWTGNATYADIHTQCPRTDNNGGCYSGGGLDDRFDFILMNRHLINDSAGIRFIPGSYKALGNDGQHFNSNINSSPVNTSAPAAVISALYLASDHLPVQADLRVAGNFTLQVKNAATSGRLQLQLREGKIWSEGLFSGEVVKASLIDMQGRITWSGALTCAGDGSLSVPSLAGGGPKMLRIQGASGRSGQVRLLGL
jgi:hypothetical protein